MSYLVQPCVAELQQHVQPRHGNLQIPVHFCRSGYKCAPCLLAVSQLDLAKSKHSQNWGTAGEAGEHSWALHYAARASSQTMACGGTNPCLFACSLGLRVPSGWSRASGGISPIPISPSTLGMSTVDGMTQLSHLPAFSGWTSSTPSGCCAGTGLLSTLSFFFFLALRFTEVKLGMLGVLSTGGCLCSILLELGLWGLQPQGWEMSWKSGKDMRQQDMRWLCRASLQPRSVPSCPAVSPGVMWVMFWQQRQVTKPISCGSQRVLWHITSNWQCLYHNV